MINTKVGDKSFVDKYQNFDRKFCSPFKCTYFLTNVSKYKARHKFIVTDKKLYSGHFTRGSASVEAMVEGKLIVITICHGENYFTRLTRGKIPFQGICISGMINVNIDDESLKDLPGAGKPLKDKTHRSPFIDPLSYKLNEIMINQNVGTEWIEMKKELT